MMTATNWRMKFPALSGISEEVSKHLDRNAKLVHLRQGALVFGRDRPAESLLLLASGSIRVQQHSETEWKTVLYRVHAGEICALTTACLLAFENPATEGIAETDVEAITVPSDDFDMLLSVSKEFRAFLFEAYSKRIAELIFVGTDISIKRPDIHSAQHVLDLANDRTTRVSHYQLTV